MIVTGTTDEGVIAIAALEDVVSGATVQDVVSIQTHEPVIAGGTGQGIGRIAPDNGVVDGLQGQRGARAVAIDVGKRVADFHRCDRRGCRVEQNRFIADAADG